MSTVLFLISAAFAAPTLDISGDCPGPMTIDVGNLPAFGQHVLVASPNPGPFTVGSGACAGTEIGLAPPFFVVAAPTAGPDGTRTYTPSLDGDQCGWSVQVVDLSDCSTSSVVPVDGGGDPVDPPADAAILSQFETNAHVPSSAPVGVTWTGDSLLVAHSAGGGPLTYVTRDGELILLIDPVSEDPDDPDGFLSLLAPGDPAWTGDDGFWVNGEFEDQDWFIAPDGTVLERRAQAPDVTQHRISHAWDGALLWGAGQDNYAPSLVFAQDEGGAVVSEFSSGYNLNGLTWDGEYLWGITFDTRELVRMSPDGSDISAVSVPDLPGPPQGLAWDGLSFWTCINTGGTDYVVEIGVTY